MKRSLIPFLEFLKILDDPEVNSAGRLNRYFSWGEKIQNQSNEEC